VHAYLTATHAGPPRRRFCGVSRAPGRGATPRAAGVRGPRDAGPGAGTRAPRGSGRGRRPRLPPGGASVFRGESSTKAVCTDTQRQTTIYTQHLERDCNSKQGTRTRVLSDRLCFEAAQPMLYSGSLRVEGSVVWSCSRGSRITSQVKSSPTDCGAPLTCARPFRTASARAAGTVEVPATKGSRCTARGGDCDADRRGQSLGRARVQREASRARGRGQVRGPRREMMMGECSRAPAVTGLPSRREESSSDRRGMAGRVRVCAS
jgi:hypothetical protein